MQLSGLWIWATVLIVTAPSQSIQGILDLVQRRLPDHVGNFEFRLVGNENVSSSIMTKENDQYIVSSTADGKILVEGNSVIALASG
jgi:alpha-N-acetylglucosaminidase